MLYFAYMKYPQRGSVTLWFTIIVAIVILGTGGYLYLSNSFAQTEQAPLSTSVQTNADHQSSPIATASVQNCGEVINAPSSDTAQQQKNTAAYACMSRAVVTCSPATMIESLPSGTGTKTFQILPGNGNYCPISDTIDSPASKLTCNIPSDFISAMVQFLEVKDQSSKLFYAIPFFFVPASTPASARPIVKNPLTGQIVTTQCISN